jgi:hypothetical protein
MKRSEMIDALAGYLEEQYDLDTSLSAIVLDFLESQGMRPPVYEKVVESQGTVSPFSETKLYYKLPCYEWEPE